MSRTSFCAAVTLCTLSCGCIGIRGSLATDTGPSPTGWSTLDRQFVHVGELVRFSFVITKGPRSKAPVSPIGLADYCIASANGELIEAHLNEAGHFEFGTTIDAKHGETITVAVAAYRQRGVRDMMKIGATWQTNEDPFDQADLVIAHDEVLLTVYRSQIELPIGTEYGELVNNGRLELVRNDGVISRVGPIRPPADGYSTDGPDSTGTIVIRYDPQAHQLNKSGTTQIRFITSNRDGPTKPVIGSLSTP